MQDKKHQFFVASAVIAAELHKATIIARDISLTASNAKALALRAGSSAAGFRALTNFIDELAQKTIRSSSHVNKIAIQLSRLASASARTDFTLEKIHLAKKKAANSPHIGSITPVEMRTQSELDTMQKRFDKLVWELESELDIIARELRTAVVLSAMSRVEATQAGKEHEASLYSIAQSVAQAAEKIQAHVNQSHQRISSI